MSLVHHLATTASSDVNVSNALVGGVMDILTLIGGWKLFIKAKQPGWGVLIPIYNLLLVVRIVRRPWWWVLFLLIPFVNIVASLFVAIDMAKTFRKSTAFGVIALWIFTFAGALLLGFGDAKYHAPQQPAAKK